MRIHVVDTETTGFGEEDEVVEIAVVTVTEHEKTIQMTRWHTLVRPTRAVVSLSARATHHITDKMLKSAPTMEELAPKLEASLDGDAWAAHYLDFDKRLLLQSGLPPALLPKRQICTWRCSLHLWPEAESHSNQVMRYFLGLDPPKMSTLPPHRALPDALITACLLVRMLSERSAVELADLTAQPALLQRVRQGKYRGKQWSEMDEGYCRWVIANFGKDEVDVLHTARHHLRRLGELRKKKFARQSLSTPPSTD